MAKITKQYAGQTANGQEVFRITLENQNGMKVQVLTYGGNLVSILAPDRNGALADVALGYDSVADYEKDGVAAGALIGRHANRIQNGEFTLNGKLYHLAQNDGPNHLHGGRVGFSKKVWSDEIRDGKLILTYISPDGEEQYPGNLTVQVAYSLTDDNQLQLEYEAVSDADTVVNLTNHCYFNLAGHDSGSILRHQLKIYAQRYTENNNQCLPTGVIAPVEDTVMDFRSFKEIGQDIEKPDPQLLNCGGYDHNFILGGDDGILRPAADLYEPESGRLLRTFTTMPGLQLYTGNFLDGSVPGKGGAYYPQHSGVCLETQYFPNALRFSHFPSPILRAGQRYHQITIYAFETR